MTTTVKPAAPSRPAIAAPMPRAAPVTIATLLLSAFMRTPPSFLPPVIARRNQMPLCGGQIISLEAVTLFAISEQWKEHGSARCDAAVRPGGRPAQLHPGGDRPRAAALDRNPGHPANGAAARRTVAPAHNAHGAADARRRGLFSPLSRHSRRCRR